MYLMGSAVAVLTWPVGNIRHGAINDERLYSLDYQSSAMKPYIVLIGVLCQMAAASLRVRLWQISPIPSSLDRRELEVREDLVDSTIGENEQALHASGCFVPTTQLKFDLAAF